MAEETAEQHGDQRAAQRALRARRAAVPRPALLGRDADDAQPRRRRGPRPGDVRQGLRRLPPVPGRHQPQGLALPDPDQHVHQHLPQEAARAAAVRRREDDRGLAARAGRVAHLDRPALGRDGGARPPAGLATSRRPCSRCRRTSGWRSTSPTSRASLQGDRRDHGHADRHRDVPAAPRPPRAAQLLERVRRRPRPRRRAGTRQSGGRDHELRQPARGRLLRGHRAGLPLPRRRDRRRARTSVREHLDECAPCLRKFGLEQDVKALVARCCGGDVAPDDLRERLVASGCSRRSWSSSTTVVEYRAD